MMNIYRELDRPAFMSHHGRLFKMAIQQGLSRKSLRMFKKVFWQGRNERDAEAYFSVR